MRGLYRFCLLALPAELRRKHGEEMEDLFYEAWTDGRGIKKLLVLAAALSDVLRARWMMRERASKPAPTRRRRITAMETLWLDLSYAVRSLRQRSGFALLALITLGLGIGAVTTVFSVVNGVLLKPLPYSASERIVILWHDLGNGAQSLPALNPLDFFDYEERGESYADWTIATGSEQILGETENPELVDVGYVAANFLPFFGADPQHGRHFLAEEDAPGGPKVAILSHRLWQRRFGGDTAVLGRTVRLAGEDHEIVGVLPASFRLLLPPEAFRLRDADVWSLAQIDRKELPPRNYTGYTGFGKLRPGVSFEEAQLEMDRLEAQLKEEHAVHEAANLQVRAVPLHGDVVKRARPTLYVLLAAVSFVLLIACGNVAQLLLARWRGGERELSVRAALGASRWRVTRLVLVESLLLTAGAAVLGVLLASFGLELLRTYASGIVPRLQDVSLDSTALAFTLALSALTAVVFSFVPALALSRVNLATALAEASRGSSSTRQVRLRNGLIIGEVTLSVVLLVATGLTVRSFQALLRAEPGFYTDGLLTIRVSLPAPEFSDDEKRRLFDIALRERVSALPGVRSVATVNQLPLTGSGTLQPYAYDEETAQNWESVTADERYVSAGFLETMGATLLAGREFTEDEVRQGRKVAVIDEQLASIAFPDRSAVGQQLRVEPLGSDDPFTEVIGVVGHLKLHDLSRPMLPQFYFPAWPMWKFSLVVRADDPDALAAPVRAEIRALSSGAAIEDVAPIESLVAAARSQARLSLVLMLGFGALAVLLAAVGLFGVISYAVSLRKFELGVRMALGASPAGIRRSVLVEGARLVVVSTLLGLAGAAALSRFLAGLLYGVDPIDAVTYIGVAVVLALVALAACWVPANRATRVDPVLVLKSD